MTTEFEMPSSKDLKQKIITEALRDLSEAPLADQIRAILERSACEPSESVKLHELIMEELEGFGPLEPLFRDPLVTEILVNSPDEIFYEREGQLWPSDLCFSSSLTLERLLRRLLRDIDRVADLRHPLVDGTLPDGTRVHIALPPVVKTAVISFRRHLQRGLNLTDLKNQGLMDDEIWKKLLTKLEAKANLLICGETGSGKTTLLRALLKEIPVRERIVAVEDTSELNVERANTISLFSRLSSDGLLPAIRLPDLIRNALRMRPDRLVVGEIRSDEALVFLDAVSTGHQGSMSSIHGNSCRQALARLEQLASRAAPQWPVELLRKLIFESVDVVICVTRTKEGRRISEVSELAGLESFGYLLEPWTRPEL